MILQLRIINYALFLSKAHHLTKDDMRITV